MSNAAVPPDRPTPGARLQERLRVDLLAARQRRDAPAVAAIGSLLTALANAEAVPVEPGPYVMLEDGADVQRQRLGEEQVRVVIDAETEERRKALAEYEALGVDASRLEAELEALERYAPDE